MKKVVIASLAVLALSLSAHAQPRPTKVALKCANPGSHQDVAKTPNITNNTRKAVPASKKIFWEATDGDKGFIWGPLGINQSKSGLGQAGNGYQCTAFYWATN